MDACLALDDCYGAARGAYNTRSDSLGKLVQQWKTEYTGLQKILCYIEIWMSDNNTETVDENQVGKCDNLAVNNSKMELEFPELPKKLGCDTAPVSIYPCTP